MSKFVFFTCLMLGCLCTINAQKTVNQSYHLLIGTYTSGKSEGIYVYAFNPRTGEVKHEYTYKGISNPSYLAVSPDRKFVYSVAEERGKKGEVSAFAFDPASGKLQFLNKESSGSEGPCYVSVDKTGRFVFVGNYSGGSLAALPVQADGSLKAPQQHIVHKGSSVNTQRQDKPHVHAVVFSPDNNYLVVPDLGMDKLMIYNFKPANNGEPLTPADPSFMAVDSGSGPRHFTFHPNGKHAYLIQELSGTITAFNYANGRLTKIQSISMLATDFNGKIGAADIHISPDGKFLYGSNRGDANDIAIYAIQEKTGLLTFKGRQSTLGKGPRNFVIDPTGQFLLVANQNSDNIIIFKRDSKTGLLTDTKKSIEIGAPVCLKMVPAK